MSEIPTDAGVIGILVAFVLYTVKKLDKIATDISKMVNGSTIVVHRKG